MPGVAYNPYDPAQARLLGALSLSEVGNARNPLNLGTGGFDLSNAEVDEYGFPQWGGTNNSHAAGFFQFQPGTWKSYAQTYDLNFQDAEDQKAGAWYLAQDTYRQETGGDLTAAIQAGEYAKIESALGKTQWLGARGKLAEFLSGGKGRDLGGGNAVSDDTSGFDWKRFNPFRNPFVDPETGQIDAAGLLPRIALFIVGGLILIAAVWWLLSSTGVVPGAGTAKAVTKIAGAVA